MQSDYTVVRLEVHKIFHQRFTLRFKGLRETQQNFAFSCLSAYIGNCFNKRSHIDVIQSNTKLLCFLFHLADWIGLWNYDLVMEIINNKWPFVAKNLFWNSCFFSNFFIWVAVSKSCTIAMLSWSYWITYAVWAVLCFFTSILHERKHLHYWETIRCKMVDFCKNEKLFIILIRSFWYKPNFKNWCSINYFWMKFRSICNQPS